MSSSVEKELNLKYKPAHFGCYTLRRNGGTFTGIINNQIMLVDTTCFCCNFENMNNGN